MVESQPVLAIREGVECNRMAFQGGSGLECCLRWVFSPVREERKCQFSGPKRCLPQAGGGHRGHRVIVGSGRNRNTGS